MRQVGHGIVALEFYPRLHIVPRSNQCQLCQRPARCFIRNIRSHAFQGALPILRPDRNAKHSQHGRRAPYSFPIHRFPKFTYFESVKHDRCSSVNKPVIAKSRSVKMNKIPVKSKSGPPGHMPRYPDTQTPTSFRRWASFIVYRPVATPMLRKHPDSRRSTGCPHPYDNSLHRDTPGGHRRHYGFQALRRRQRHRAIFSVSARGS